MCKEECIKWVSLLPCNIKHVATFIPKTETHEGKRMTIERVLYLRFLFSAPSPTHTREHAHAHMCELHVQSCEDVEQSSTVRARCRVSGRQGRGWGIPEVEEVHVGPFSGVGGESSLAWRQPEVDTSLGADWGSSSRSDAEWGCLQDLGDGMSMNIGRDHGSDRKIVFPHTLCISEWSATVAGGQRSVEAQKDTT